MFIYSPGSRIPSTHTLSKHRGAISRAGTYETIFTNDDRIVSQLGGHSSHQQRHRIPTKLFLSKTTDNLLKPYQHLKGISVPRSLSLHSPLLERPESHLSTYDTVSIASRQSKCYVTVDEEEDTHFDIRDRKQMKKSHTFSSNTAETTAGKKVTTPKSKTVDEKVYLLLEPKR
mgnify:FL=1